MQCGNCHAKIDWNAVRQCLCYRGPVLGATHRELDDEDRRIHRRIRERVRRKRNGTTKAAAAGAAPRPPDLDERNRRCS